MQSFFKDVMKKMDATCEKLREDLSHIRTGRANTAILDGITIDYYGTPTPLNQVGSVSAPEPRLIVVQPWDSSLLKEIEKAILSSDLGLNPANDGKILRLPIPELTEERRKDIVKKVKKLGEDAKVAIRNIRRDANDQVKKQEKAHEISEDQMHDALDEIQKYTDEHIKKLDTIVKVKEDEVMEV